jgi:hypothetical protein
MADRRLATESEMESLFGAGDGDVLSALQQQYQAPAAPVAQAPAPVLPSATEGFTPEAQAYLARSKPLENRINDVRLSSADDFQLFRPVGYKDGITTYEVFDPYGGSRGTVEVNTGGNLEEGLRTFAALAAPLLSVGVATLMTPAFASFGVSQATAAALARAIAPTIVQTAITGNFNIEQAGRNALVSYVAPRIGSTVALNAANTLFDTFEIDMPVEVQRALSNAVASAAATAIQQGADSSDIGRNMLAGAISSAVATTLNGAGLDPALSAGIGRAAGTYVSTEDAAQSIINGITRGLTFEQQRQAVLDERNAKAIERAYQDPTRALDVEPAASVEQSAPVVDSGAADVVASTEIVGQAPEPVSAADIQEAIRQDQAAAAPPLPVQQIPISAPAVAPAPEEPISALPPAAAAEPPPPPPPPAPPAPEPAPTPASEPVAPVQSIEVTAPAAPPVLTDEEVFAALQEQIEPPAPPPPPPAPPTPLQTQEVVGARPGAQNDEEQFARIGDLRPVNVAPFEEFEVRVGEPGRIDITGQRIQEGPTDEEVFYQLMSELRPAEPAPAAPPVPQIPVVGARLPQEITVAGTAPTGEDVLANVPPSAGEPQQIEITGQRAPQEVTVVGTPPTDEDILSFIMPEEPVPAPAPAPAPEEREPVSPTDIFTSVRRGRPSPLQPSPPPVLRGPSQTGLSAIRPAGEIESEVTGRRRQNVWNEASLRLRDALGL